LVGHGGSTAAAVIGKADRGRVNEFCPHSLLRKGMGRPQ
jgi:hypothetical protein